MCCQSNRKILNKGILLYIHFNLFLALLLALIVFVGGIETFTNTKVSICETHILILKHVSLLSCVYSGYVVQWQQYCTTSFSVCSAGAWLRASWCICWLSEYSAAHLKNGTTSFLLDGVCSKLYASHALSLHGSVSWDMFKYPYRCSYSNCCCISGNKTWVLWYNFIVSFGI